MTSCRSCSSHSSWCCVSGRETWVFSGFGIKLGGRGCCGSPNTGHQWGPWDSTGGVAEANFSFPKHAAPIRWLLCMSTKIIIYNSGHLWAESCRRRLFIPPSPFTTLQTLPWLPRKLLGKKEGWENQSEKTHMLRLPSWSPRSPWKE